MSSRFRGNRNKKFKYYLIEVGDIRAFRNTDIVTTKRMTAQQADVENEKMRCVGEGNIEWQTPYPGLLRDRIINFPNRFIEVNSATSS